MFSPRHSNNASLDLVGVPSNQDAANESNFDFDPNLNYGLDAGLNADIDALFAKAGLPDGQTLNDFDFTSNLTPAKTGFEPSEVSQVYYSDGLHSYLNEPPDHNSYPVPQAYKYPEPQDYYAPRIEPYYNSSYDSFAPTQDMFCTPGFTAIPGNSSAIDYGNGQYPSNPYAYSIGSWSAPANAADLLTEHTGYMPVGTSSHWDTTMQHVAYPCDGSLVPTEPESFAMRNHAFTQAKRKHSHADSDDEDETSLTAPVKKRTRQIRQEEESDDDYNDTETKAKAAKKSQRETQQRSRNNSVSSDSTSTASASAPVKYLPGEKPRKVVELPWIRVNASTEGDTRTAKINNWKNKYKYKPLPLGTWSSGKHTFKYTSYNYVDFLNEAPMSTRKVKEYITKYPCDENKRLILWIQKMPGDSARRYGSEQHSKCVFKDCPIQRYIEGTISTGEYRVAFDEKHYTYGDKVDPYDCTAYAHLYCMEQFLDFEQVCQVADVRVDTRLDLELEPNGKAAFSTIDVPARYEMERFVKAASEHQLRSTKRWRNYPVHSDYERDHQKPHKFTLTHLAHRMYEAYQDDSHKRQAALRRVTVSQRRVHLGDLEMYVADKRIRKELLGSKKKGRKGKVEDYYDDHIRAHIERAKQEAEQFLKGDSQQKKKARKKTAKRKAAEREVTDDEEPVYDQDRTIHGTEQQQYTTSPRKAHASQREKQRVNYADSPIDAQHQCTQATYTQAQDVQAPEQQLQPYSTTNHSYEPTPVPNETPIDPALSNPYGLFAIPTRKLSCSDFFPTQATLDISDFPASQDDIPDDNLEKLLALERRQSCIADIGPMSILHSPELSRSGRTPRQAFFNAQPVTSSKEYCSDDPPSLVTVSKDVEFGRYGNGCGRRSARLRRRRIG